MTLLVVGGTGHYGRHAVGSLAANGQSVRVLSRDAIRARRLLGDAVDVVEGDITSRRAVREALRGVTALLVSISAFTPRLIRKLRLIERDSVLALLERARSAGIRRVVYVSVYDIRKEILERFRLETGRIKLEVETALAESEFDWLVLGAAPSMEIYFRMLRADKMTVPGGGKRPLPTISPTDVGEIAAQALLRDDLRRRRIRMTGPEALSFPDAARRISAALGRRIVVRKVPLLGIRLAALLTRPISPYLRHLSALLHLMNSFPQDLAAEVPMDHQRLIQTFSYTPTTLEMEGRRWLRKQGAD